MGPADAGKSELKSAKQMPQVDTGTITTGHGKDVPRF